MRLHPHACPRAHRPERGVGTVCEHACVHMGLCAPESGYLGAPRWCVGLRVHRCGQVSGVGPAVALSAHPCTAMREEPRALTWTHRLQILLLKLQPSPTSALCPQLQPLEANGVCSTGGPRIQSQEGQGQVLVQLLSVSLRFLICYIR